MNDPASGRMALLTTLFAAFNHHDPDGVMACFDPGVVFDTAAGPDAFGQRIVGSAAVRAEFVATWTAMPDVAWQVRHHAVFGDRAISEWLFTATDRQGGRIEVEGIDLFTFAGERIARKNAFRKDRRPPAAR